MTRQMKPKTNRKGKPHEPSKFDDCKSPSYAIDPIRPYLYGRAIWEPFAGPSDLAGPTGNMARTLEYYGYPTIATDIGGGQDFFDYVPIRWWDTIISNPPYSVKYKVLKRCYELGQPFALLMPVEMIASKTASQMFEKYGIEIIYPIPRINFFMPDLGYCGNGAQFSTAWYCWKMGIGAEKMWVNVPHHYLPFEQAMVDYRPPEELLKKKMTDKIRLRNYEEALITIAEWGRGNPNEPWVRAHHLPLIELAEQTLISCSHQ